MTTTHSQFSVGDKGIQSQVVYDGFGRTSESRTYTSSQQYLAVDQTYDAAGAVSCVGNPLVVPTSSGNLNNPGTTCYVHDSLGRLTSVTMPDNSVATTNYYGTAVRQIDPSNNAVETSADALGRITSVREDPAGLNLITNYGYDALGDLTYVFKCAAGSNCASGQQRQFYYDAMGRMTQSVNPESGTVNYNYKSGSPGVYKTTLQSRQDARGYWTTYSYDLNSRLTGVTYGDGSPTLSYVYDGVGNLTQAKASSNSGSVTNNYSYDADNRPLTSNLQIGGITYPFNYTYDLAGDVQTEKYPSGRTINTNYDGAQRATNMNGQLGSTTTPYVQAPSYWPHGAIFGLAYGNNVWTYYAFNSRLQPFQNYHVYNNQPLYFNFMQYAYNANGTAHNTLEIYGQQFAPGGGTSISQVYAFDTLNRLTGVTDSSNSTNYSRSFAYDEFGNMTLTANSNPGVPLSSLTPQAGGINSSNNRIISATYNDARGNLTALGAVSMAYDGESRQTQTIDSGTGQTINYLDDQLSV